jgi:hypothetical protein
MLKIRNLILVLGVLMSPLAVSDTQVSIGIGLPHVSIGINLPAYPQLVRVPGYPVYYAPRLNANYFFYDGLYWVFQCTSCASRCATTASHLPISAGGGRMRRHAGVRTGAVTGNSVEAAGTSGIAVRPPHLPRCPPTSDSIQGTSIPGKWSSSASFNRSVTVTSRVTPSCSSIIRSATSGRNRINGVISETSGIGGGIKISGEIGIGIANPS